MDANPLFSGAMLGVAGTLLALFGLLAAVDNRYLTRREFNATLKDIQRQLDEIKGALGIRRRGETR